jgi:GNAT superfamily N-acetyltransferase
MHTITFSHADASCKLVPVEPDVYLLMNMWSKTKGRGHGHSLLTEVCNWADEHRATIFLVVQQYGPPRQGLSNAQLVEFYGRHGFVVDERVKRSRQMIRYYSQEKHTL